MDRTPQSQLVQDACRGSREAFSQLARCHQPQMRTLAARLLGNPLDAEDVVQEALAKALAGLPQLQEPDKFTAWLTSIVINECRQLRRRNRPLTLPLPDELETSGSAPSSGRNLGAVLAETAARILDMAPRESVAAAWFYFHGASYAQIADGLGTTEAAVQSALQRVRSKLRTEEKDIRKKGEAMMDSLEPDVRHMVRTGDLTVEDLALGETRWGENRFSCHMQNTSCARVFLSLDIRACVAKAGNWQRQWFYELRPAEERQVSEVYRIFRVLCPWYSVFRGPGIARVRVTLTRLNEEEFREQSGRWITQSPEAFLFQRWFQVMVPADSQAQGIPVMPVLPQAGDVTVEKVEFGSTPPGNRVLRVTCWNHTNQVRQIRLHIDAPGFGGGEGLCLEPGAQREAVLEYQVRQEDGGDRLGERAVLLHVIQLPLNMAELDLEDVGPVFHGQYVAEVPDALVARASFAMG